MKLYLDRTEDFNSVDFENVLNLFKGYTGTTVKQLDDTCIPFK